ncbi:MAG: hypothetical protein HZA84_05785, partial [Thaumarchaeota archaeon]|nr:hypothetical protein [Nitrososphaerota archaeon]
IKEDKTIGVVEIFEAKKQNILLNYTKNVVEQLSPAYVVLTTVWKDLNYDQYHNATDKMREFRNTFDVVIRPEGDLDTINILNNPARYKIDTKKAFRLLQNKKKKIGISLTLRFNNTKNTTEEITSAIKELIHLNSQFRS